MPQAIMILLDNSDYSINGDYMPTRWASQIDCAGLLIQARMEQDHQVHIGLGLMAGKQTEIICTPTNDMTKVTAYLYGIKQTGLVNFCQSLQIASLALKHRSDPNLRQRIIVFVASAIRDSPEEIKIIGRKLKKNSIAIDLIGLGDTSNEQRNKLTSLLQAVNHEDNSTMKIIEPGVNSLSDILIGSQMFGGARGMPMMNEQDDPELAMALRMSLEEAGMGSQPPQNKEEKNEQNLEDEELEKKALELSLEDKDPEKGKGKNDPEKKKDKKDPDDEMKQE